MNAAALQERISSGALGAYSSLWSDPARQAQRWKAALDAFVSYFGEDDQLRLFSVPGRSEISGNHTDHNRGIVLAGAIDRDVIAVVRPRTDGIIRLKSEGFPEDKIDLGDVRSPDNFARYSSRALIAGVCRAFWDRGAVIGGFDAYTTTEVLAGSGLSSSAAFEVMVGNILNGLFCNGTFSAADLAKMAQYAENEYFGKPCGLMDQMACAVGGFVEIDFADPAEPVVTPIDFSLTDAGYTLCIVGTGGSHADLNEDYASVPAEMKAVARALGQEVLRGLSERDITAALPRLREETGDRAVLRALHFVRENERVTAQARALQRGDVAAFLAGVSGSGHSSFEYLQNVYTTQNPAEQGLSLALCVTEGLLDGRGCAWRVHGGGFAGTVQAYVKNELVGDYAREMDRLFGAGATMILRIRPVGATEIVL